MGQRAERRGPAAAKKELRRRGLRVVLRVVRRRRRGGWWFQNRWVRCWLRRGGAPQVRVRQVCEWRVCWRGWRWSGERLRVVCWWGSCCCQVCGRLYPHSAHPPCCAQPPPVQAPWPATGSCRPAPPPQCPPPVHPPVRRKCRRHRGGVARRGWGCDRGRAAQVRWGGGGWRKQGPQGEARREVSTWNRRRRRRG